MMEARRRKQDRSVGWIGEAAKADIVVCSHARAQVKEGTPGDEKLWKGGCRWGRREKERIWLLLEGQVLRDWGWGRGKDQKSS